MRSWVLGAFANGAIAAAYVAIALTIGRGITASRQWRTNPLAVATALIFFSCGVGHAIHFVHIALDDHHARASQVWHLVVWDAGTAVAAAWYWTLRSRFPALVRGAALFEDLRERQRQAMQIHDNVVQGVATAKMAIELGDTDLAHASLETTLTRAKAIITELLGDADPSDLRLRRDEAAVVRPPDL